MQAEPPLSQLPQCHNGTEAASGKCRESGGDYGNKHKTIGRGPHFQQNNGQKSSSASAKMHAILDQLAQFPALGYNFNASSIVQFTVSCIALLCGLPNAN
ncbi:hypothetical protein ACLKA6_018747 [Drosophila palustris]